MLRLKHTFPPSQPTPALEKPMLVKPWKLPWLLSKPTWDSIGLQSPAQLQNLVRKYRLEGLSRVEREVVSL